MSRPVSREEFDELSKDVRRLHGSFGDVKARVQRGARGGGADEDVWRCDGCGELLMIVDVHSREHRDSNGKRTIRVHPSSGTTIEVTCNNCARRNARTF